MSLSSDEMVSSDDPSEEEGQDSAVDVRKVMEVIDESSKGSKGKEKVVKKKKKKIQRARVPSGSRVSQRSHWGYPTRKVS
jgi:hypothetical protein